MSLKTYIEAVADFGFERKKEPEQSVSDSKPIDSFNLEEMMQLVAAKKVGTFRPRSNFVNELQWGERHGAIRLEVGPNYTFEIQRLGFDLEGNRRWVTKKLFQLDRRGFGGYEESVAEEIHDEILDVFADDMGSPLKDYEKLENLVMKVAEKMKLVAQEKFLFTGIRKINKDAYIIIFEVASGGVETRDHLRVDQLQTWMGYDSATGMIRVLMQKVASPVGGSRDWKIQPADMNLFFFPSQGRDEIAECVATKFRYF
jgi:hypothetical protein